MYVLKWNWGNGWKRKNRSCIRLLNFQNDYTLYNYLKCCSTIADLGMIASLSSPLPSSSGSSPKPSTVIRFSESVCKAGVGYDSLARTGLYTSIVNSISPLANTSIFNTLNLAANSHCPFLFFTTYLLQIESHYSTKWPKTHNQ